MYAHGGKSDVGSCSRTRSSIMTFAAAALLLLFSSLGFSAQDEPADVRFPDANMAPIAGWTGPVFHLSQRYPEAQPPKDAYPWQKIDFRTHAKEYLQAVLAYCVVGNDEVDWDVSKNAVRPWYHTPWLHWGRNGREFIHGLTYERVSQPLELAPSQTSQFQNWAVGVYNAPGGYVIGRVWADANNPNPKAASFPEGTVSVKLLFTQATPAQVPYLVNSKEWQAYIYDSINIPTNPQARRTAATLRLLQVDIAVRDFRSATGWVFGTFAYNGFSGGKTVWDRMIPVGLMWGNDPGVLNNAVKNSGRLKESVINDTDPDLPIEHLGWGGRLNGPVDNTYSSCLSCHGTAQWPATSPIVPPGSIKPDSPEWMRWFRNIKAGEPFDAGSQSLDFSLQLSSGIQNFCDWNRTAVTRGGAPASDAGLKDVCKPPRVHGMDASGLLRLYPVSRGPEDQ